MRPSPSAAGRVRVGTIVLMLALAGALAAVPRAGSYTLYVLALVGVQIIAVLSLNVLMGYAGQVSLGQAAFVGIGAFSAAQLVAWHVPFALVIPCAVVVTAAITTLVGLPSLRIKGLQVAATTLAFGVVAQQLLFVRPWAEGSSLGMTAARPRLVSSDQRFLLLVLGAVVLAAVVDRSLRRSRVGRAFMGVRDSEDTAAARGIAVARTKLLAYAISGAYAGLAGACYAFLLERVTPGPFTIWASLGYVAMVVVGGLGSFAGAVVAGSGFTVLPELLRSTAAYAPLAGAVLLMTLPIVRPQGLSWLLDRRLVRSRPRSKEAMEQVALDPPRRPLRLLLPAHPLLVVEGVTLAFGGLQVLDDVNIEVHRGESVGLIGPNGAGKSTLFNCLSGFLEPRGRIRYHGEDLVGRPPELRAALGIGRTFQQVGLCPAQTVWENTLLAQHSLAGYGVVSAILRPSRVRGVEAELARRAHTALELAGIADLADARVVDLPHGRQRLAEVAAVLAAGPDLLLLDEPAAGMDPREADELATLLTDLQAQLGLTMVVIDHHVPFVADVCSYVYVLVEGAVVAEGTAAEVQRDPVVAEVYLGEASPAEPVLEVIGV